MKDERGKIHVVYAANEGFVRHLAASLYSLLFKSRGRNFVSVFILSMGISEESKEKLEEMASLFPCEIRFFDLGDLNERFGTQVHGGGFDISIFGRFFVGEVLPETVERVLYLDCDTIVLEPLDQLWRTDLDGHILGAVMEPTIYEQVKEQIGLRPEEPYFNSGVLLIDLKAWRANGILKRLLDFYGRFSGELLAGDQDTLNGVLKDRILPLSPRYNFFTNYRYFPYRELVSLSPSYERIQNSEFCRAVDHPVILHFMGDERPWKAGNLNHYRKAYERCLEKTPWAGTKKEEGQRFYMLAYHLMDYVTFFCPPVRRLISKNLGMKAIQARRKPVREIGGTSGWRG